MSAKSNLRMMFCFRNGSKVCEKLLTTSRQTTLVQWRVWRNSEFNNICCVQLYAKDIRIPNNITIFFVCINTLNLWRQLGIRNAHSVSQWLHTYRRGAIWMFTQIPSRFKKHWPIKLKWMPYAHNKYKRRPQNGGKPVSCLYGSLWHLISQLKVLASSVICVVCYVENK